MDVPISVAEAAYNKFVTGTPATDRPLINELAETHFATAPTSYTTPGVAASIQQYVVPLCVGALGSTGVGVGAMEPQGIAHHVLITPTWERKGGHVRQISRWDLFTDSEASADLCTASLSSLVEVKERTCRTLIEKIDKLSVPTWGSLRKRLLELLELSQDPAEGYAPLAPSSLSTLMELVRKLPDTKRPAITLTSSGKLWIEWNLGNRQRLAMEILPSAQIRYAWVKPDIRNPKLFASRYGTTSIDEFISEEFTLGPILNSLRRSTVHG